MLDQIVAIGAVLVLGFIVICFGLIFVSALGWI